jgi:hypothetical protein
MTGMRVAQMSSTLDELEAQSATALTSASYGNTVAVDGTAASGVHLRVTATSQLTLVFCRN